MVALLGTLSVLMIARIGRRLFRSTLLGCVAGLLLAVDGLHFVHSRTALLDLHPHVLGARGVRRAADRPRPRRGNGWPSGRPGRRPGRRLRPRARAAARGGSLAGVCLGLACATKWSGPVLRRRLRPDDRAAGTSAPAGRPASAGPASAPWSRDAGPAFVSLVLVAIAVYLASLDRLVPRSATTPTCATGRSDNPGTAVVPDALRSLWHYHHGSVGLPHRTWIVPPVPVQPVGLDAARPPGLVLLRGPEAGRDGCKVEECSQAITALGTPAIWWAGVPRAPRCCSSSGSGGATGAPARSWPGSPAATCPGSSSRTARSTPSTRWPSCRGWCSP